MDKRAYQWHILVNFFQKLFEMPQIDEPSTPYLEVPAKATEKSSRPISVDFAYPWKWHELKTQKVTRYDSFKYLEFSLFSKSIVILPNKNEN